MKLALGGIRSNVAVSLPLVLIFNTDKMRETINAIVTVSINIFILLLYFYVIRKFMSSKHRNIKLNDASSKHGNTRINSRREYLIILNSVAVAVCFAICYLHITTSYLTGTKKWSSITESICAFNTVADPLIYFLFLQYKNKTAIFRRRKEKEHGQRGKSLTLWIYV